MALEVSEGRLEVQRAVLIYTRFTHSEHHLQRLIPRPNYHEWNMRYAWPADQKPGQA